MCVMDSEPAGVGDSREASPFVGCFRTANGYYIYDVNTNEVIRVDPATYQVLLQATTDRFEPGRSNAGGRDPTPAIGTLVAEGYLSPHRPKGLSIPGGKVGFHNQVQNHLEHCILELTQECNLRCKYCSYSPTNPGQRNHSKKEMPLSSAKKAIDLLIESSGHSKRIALGFYGGEPLLRWDLLKECVRYFRKRAAARETTINFTTNGTLITREIAQFCADNMIAVSVSIDGPKDLHDAHRRFRKDQSGSYDEAIEGLSLLRKAYKDIYKRIREPLGDGPGLMGMCLPGIRKYFVDVDGRILPCERVSESLVIGSVHDSGIDPQKSLALCNEIVEFFGRRCPPCVFCRICSGCVAQYTDISGELSETAMERHCAESADECRRIIVQWTGVLEKNPQCLDHLEPIALS